MNFCRYQKDGSVETLDEFKYIRTAIPEAGAQDQPRRPIGLLANLNDEPVSSTQQNKRLQIRNLPFLSVLCSPKLTLEKKPMINLKQVPS